MPIYNNSLLSTQYKITTKISVSEFKKLLKIFDKAKSEFPYNKKYYFLKTIDQSNAAKSLNNYEDKVIFKGQKYLNDLKSIFPFIAEYYNDPKFAIPDSIYILMMESLIFHANKLLTTSSKYKFDIGGSWTNGKVILMEKK